MFWVALMRTVSDDCSPPSAGGLYSVGSCAWRQVPMHGDTSAHICPPTFALLSRLLSAPCFALAIAPGFALR